MIAHAGDSRLEEKAVVLVLGAARSGTTMLDLMLGNADDVFSCGEVWALFRPHRKHHFAPACLCGDPDCAVWKELANCTEANFHTNALQRPGIKYVVDSSKDLRWAVDSHKWAMQSGHAIHNVIIWKDPVSLSYSHWKRGQPVDYYRKAFVRYYGRFLKLKLPFISISYNRVVQDSAQIMKDLCITLGMDHQPGREEFWRKRHHHMFGSAGTAKQVASGNSELKLQTEFPGEFTAAFEAHKKASGEDAELNKIIEGLQAHELGRQPEGQPEKSLINSALKPGWYYYHLLKAQFRKRFPESGPVAD